MEGELGLVVGLVVRDFVQDWFRDLSADPSFPRCVFVQIAQAVESVVERARARIDVAEFVVGVVLPLATAHIRTIRDCEALIRQQDAGDGEEDEGEEGDDRSKRQKERHRRVDQAYAAAATSKWHPALNALRKAAEAEEEDEDEEREKLVEKKLVQAHVRRVVDLILPLILSADHLSFAPHRVLVRELLNGALLAPLVQGIAEPDTINQLVDGQLERLIREQHMVTELREALDRQARGIAEEEEGEMAVAEEMAAVGGLPVRTYEQFMTTIDECSDARELARIRDDIVAQIRKRRILIMGQSKDNIVHGQRVGDVIVYVNRLYVAKKKAERRIEQLSEAHPLPPHPHSSQSLSRMSTYYDHRDDPASLGPPQFTLREMLTNVSSLSVFAEYMDLIGHRFVLEFWINVEGVKQAEPGMPLGSVLSSLWKTYFTLRVDELAALGSDVEAAVSRVQRCLKPHRLAATLVDLDVERMSAAVCTEAFDLVCLVQAAVFRHMEQAEFPSFLRSALYSRFLREYYVTPRQNHLEASLFASAIKEEDTSPSPPTTTTRPRRMSLVRSMAGSIGRRSVSGDSSAASAVVTAAETPKPASESRRVWTFGGMRSARPEAPLVSTDTAVARGTHSQGPTEPAPVVVVERRRSVVARSEVRRLSASLRTIGLGEGEEGEGDEVQMEPINSEEEEEGEDIDESSEEEADEALSSDEASALVIGRAVITPSPGDL
ncbi:tRNA (guanine-N(7)-)-methyltransferase (tRNA(m7G46)-methyltransferase), partial [Coemansia aciculifera]